MVAKQGYINLIECLLLDCTIHKMNKIEMRREREAQGEKRRRTTKAQVGQTGTDGCDAGD